ncbi:MAG: DUF5615 family PIN-like protein [Magnetococcales bacterium]|nr:DUF5615 family PIN-like protein [Magnetococcales bacterium]
MRYLVDAQLPVALARFLAGTGREAEHVADVGLAGAGDAAIWKYAIQTGAAIVTKDDDFVKQSHFVSNGPAIVWVRVGNRSKKQTLLWFEKVVPAIEEALLSGETIVEIIG